MGRPTDWTPLGRASDPVPGEPEAIGREAAHLTAVARQITGQVAALRKIAAAGSGGELKGRYAGKLHTAAADVAGQLEEVQGRYRETAAALAEWFPRLEQAQRLSLRALDQAEDPYRRLQQAVALPSGPNLTAAQKQEIAAHQAALNSARQQLGEARALLARAVSLRDEAAARCAARIRAATDDGVKDSWWQSHIDTAWHEVAHGFDVARHEAAYAADIVKRHNKLIGEVGNVLGDISAFLAIAGLVIAWIPGVDLLTPVLEALALSGEALETVEGSLETVTASTAILALGAHAIARSLGDNEVSNVDMIFDAIGAAAFGDAKLSGAALKSLRSQRNALKAAGDFGEARRILFGPMHDLRLVRDIGWWADKATGAAALAYAAVDRHLRELRPDSWSSFDSAETDTATAIKDGAYVFWMAVESESAR